MGTPPTGTEGIAGELDSPPPPPHAASAIVLTTTENLRLCIPFQRFVLLKYRAPVPYRWPCTNVEDLSLFYDQKKRSQIDYVRAANCLDHA